MRLLHSGDSDHKLILLFLYPLLPVDQHDHHLVLNSYASHDLKEVQKAQDLQNLKMLMNKVLKSNCISDTRCRHAMNQNFKTIRHMHL